MGAKGATPDTWINRHAAAYQWKRVPHRQCEAGHAKKGGRLAAPPFQFLSHKRLGSGGDELNGIAEALNCFCCIVRDFDTEFLFERHHELNSVEAVSAQIVDEGRALNNFVFFNTKVLYNDLTYAVCDIAHVKFLT
jgi:hypothetical protein